jgi:hypothetical protein
MKGRAPGFKAVPLAALALLSVVLLLLQLGYSEPGLLYLAPALLLLAALSLNRYPGERLLLRISRAWARRKRRQGHSEEPGAANPPLRFPRGGVLLAMALAGRGPPA